MNSKSVCHALALLLSSTCLCSGALAAEPGLQFKRGDHVSYIGNTLADRMQHVGWLETLIQSRHPKHELVFRNLGFPGDELDRRPRSANFGSADDWLKKNETDVVFAFFGYNESFAGKSGLPGFRDKLVKFIDHTRGQKYNGESAPQLVLFSPIAHEDLDSPHLPDGSENNARLRDYTNVMKDVAKEKEVLFVDLFSATGELYAESAKPLTINGIHLTPEGNRQVAYEIDRALFHDMPERDDKQLEKIRTAVLDKNFHWFNRYRTVDGYNVFGGRSKLAWFGQSNFDVMQREMEIFDVMTANRDKQIWAVARGGSMPVDDSNTPELLKVRTNKPGPVEGGKYPFLGGVEAIDKMKIAEGMQVNLFASEEMFPELVNPVQMSVDADGRLWVATWPTYPHWNPKEDLKDKIVILPDEDRDGKADEAIVFADGLNSVTGFEFWGGGVVVAAAPELLFLKDTDGDDRADLKIRMLQGVSSADTHHTANALVIGTDGALYWSRGVFHVTNMETPSGTFRSTRSGVYRFDPRTYEVSFHFPIGPNPHGHVVDQWGYQFASDGTSGTGSYMSVGKGVGAPKQWYQKRVRPVPATGILSSSHFPERNNGNFLICNAIGFLGVLQHRIEYDGADINAVEIEPILVSSDPNFRPTDLEIGGDGALYVSDWCNPLIGHMQHNIRDPNRDHLHGRIYRVTAKGRDLLEPVKMKGKPIEEILPNFYAQENGTRYRARLELSGRETADVAAKVQKWVDGIEPDTPADEQALLEGLWVFEEHRVANQKLLKKVFQAREPRVRAAAIRTLGHWGPRITDWDDLLLAAARDEEPLVRAEAVKAAVEFEGLAAAEAIFEVANRPTDVQLDFVLKYATGKINVDALVQDALKSGKPLSLAAEKYVLRNASVNDLLKMQRTEAVYEAILARDKVPASALQEALAGLAQLKQTDDLELLLGLIDQRDTAEGSDNLASLNSLLAAQSAADLRGQLAHIKKLASSGRAASTRQAGLAAWIAADGSAADAVEVASRDKSSLRDLLESIPSIKSAEVRRAMFRDVRKLIFELPEHLQADSGGAAITQNGIQVDFFAPSPSNVAIETLAKMKPKASGIVPEIKMDVPQLKTRDKFALRFTGSIYIEKSGKHTFFTNSDDGSRLYIGDKLVVNNDGLHGMREKGGSINLPAGSHPLVVTYFDNGGGDGLIVSWQGPGFGKQRIPASKLSITGADTLHDVAIRALKSIPGNDVQKFNDLAKLIQTGKHRTSAIHAILDVPKKHWPKNKVPTLVDNMIAYVSEIPAEYRTGAAALDAMKLTKEAASFLPAEQAQAIEDRLANLDVRVIAIGTIPHRMKFDKQRIVVQAGKPVEFRFSNSDSMPHNFAIVQPGSLVEVGLLGEATAEEPDAMERHYIPESDAIMLASRLLQPQQTQALTFEVPQKPGIYPYVCTYPGHWRRMYGALYVVADVAAYNRNPAEYLKSQGIASQDKPLEYLGRETEWKLADLIADLPSVEQGRSFEVGQEVFKVASCISCHKMNGEGFEFGPDLTKVDPKKPLDHFLRSVVEPSHTIEEEYQTYAFQLESGQTLSGMIVEETPDVVKVIENPLKKAKPIEIPAEEIAAKKKLPTSLMPAGLVNKLTREEILDLVAYIYARGDQKHKLFHQHEH